MTPERLFRGDKANNGTSAEKYRSAGLMTKLLNGGNPAYVQRHGLLNSVRAHVKPSTIDEETFQSKSMFMSFSSNCDVSLFYAADGKPGDLIPSEPFQELRYLFTFLIDKHSLAECEDGIFLLTYAHDIQLEDGDSPFDRYVMKQRRDSGYARCEICEARETHKVFLIDVVTYLDKNPKCAINEQARVNAARDFEWLLMPADYSAELRGTSSRLPRSRIWSAEHFRLKVEAPRDTDMFAMLGTDVTDE
jgi:hypothetical protein